MSNNAQSQVPCGSAQCVSDFDRSWILFGAIGAALAVIAGAFGAHAMDTFLSTAEEGPRRLAAWKTGASYQMYHALGLILLGLMPTRKIRMRRAAGVLFVIGMLIFSGVLYLYALTHIKILGAIVPIGGVSMIAGWIAFAISAIGCQPNISRTSSPSSNS